MGLLKISYDVVRIFASFIFNNFGKDESENRVRLAHKELFEWIKAKP